MMKFLVLTTAILFGACATGDEVTSEDFTEGTPTQNEGNMPVTPPTSGSGGQEQTPIYPACRSTADCFANEVCDPNSTTCVDPMQTTPGSPADAGVAMPGNMDMGSSASNPNPPSGNGCTLTSDVQIFQTALVCTDGCEIDYEAESQRCQQTPSRLADCLAAAAQAKNECNNNCPDLSRSMTACLSVCLNDPNVGTCARDCFTQSFTLSSPCHDCFVGAFECGANFCQAVCSNDSDDECELCLQSSCGQAFEQCAGLALP